MNILVNKLGSGTNDFQTQVDFDDLMVLRFIIHTKLIASGNYLSVSVWYFGVTFRFRHSLLYSQNEVFVRKYVL